MWVIFMIFKISKSIQLQDCFSTETYQQLNQDLDL